MVDLLPTLTVTAEMLTVAETASMEGGRGASPWYGDRGVSPLADVGTKVVKGDYGRGQDRSPSHQSDESFYDAVEESGFPPAEGEESEIVVDPSLVDVVVEVEEERDRERSVEELKQVSQHVRLTTV